MTTDRRQTVALTGASGFVGRQMVRTLLKDGYAVRALVRDAEKARAVLPPDAALTTIRGSTDSAESLRELVLGSDACIHLVGIIRESGRDTFRSAHVESTRRVLDACRGTTTSAAVRRYVHMSALGVHPEGTPYQRTKFEAEQLVRRSGLDWTIFRPGYIHGPDGELTGMIRQWCSGAKQPFFFIPYFARDEKIFTDALLPTIRLSPAVVAPVSVRDVCRAFVESLRRPATFAEIYNLVGPQNLSFKAMLEWWRDHLPHAEQSLSCVGVPASAASIQARVAKLIGLGNLLPFDEGMPLMAAEDATADLTKLRADLGFEPEAFEPAAARYVSSL
ncbi:MAG: NAD(P)H-binding protein [Phycisphaerales bacterium]